MPDSPFLTLRQGVRNYLRSCDHLLSVPAAPHNPLLSIDELLIIDYCMAEVAMIVGHLAKGVSIRSFPEPITTVWKG